MSVALFSWFAGSSGAAVAEAGSSDAKLLTLINELSQQEGQYQDIVSDAAKSIEWFDGIKQTDIALVYLHGFSASAREISPVTENVAKALGANVYFARLTGHGRTGEAMAEASMEDWLRDTRDAWRIGQQIGKRVVMIGTSTGATLVSWLTSQDYAQDMLASILISPNFGVASRSAEIIRWDWGLKVAKLISGPTRGFEPQNELHERYWTETYPMEALQPMLQLVDQVLDQDHSQTQIPHMMVFSPNDKVIRVDRIRQIAEQMSASDVKLVEFLDATDPAQHVLAGEACSPSSTNQMVTLIEDYVRGLRRP